MFCLFLFCCCLPDRNRVWAEPPPPSPERQRRTSWLPVAENLEAGRGRVGFAGGCRLLGRAVSERGLAAALGDSVGRKEGAGGNSWQVPGRAESKWDEVEGHQGRVRVSRVTFDPVGGRLLFLGGRPVPENEMGRTYLRPRTGTGMPSKERFQHAPFGACFERGPSIEITSFVLDSSRSSRIMV